MYNNEGRDARRALHHRQRSGVGRRAGAIAGLAVMPPLSLALALLTWQGLISLARQIDRAPSLALSTVTIADVLMVAAGVAGAAIAAHLSLTGVLLIATPRRSRLHATVTRLTPAGWRRLVSIAAAGAMTAGLALPAASSPGSSDAGWVPEPIAHEDAAPPESPPATPPPPLRSEAQASDAKPSDAGPSDAQRTTDPSYVVARGDSLWSITAAALEGESAGGGPDVDTERIAAAWPQLYDANRHTVGSEPSLIHPGQRLIMPEEWSK